MKTCRFERHAIAGSRQDRGHARPESIEARRQRLWAYLRDPTAGCSHPPGGRRCEHHDDARRAEG